MKHISSKYFYAHAGICIFITVFLWYGIIGIRQAGAQAPHHVSVHAAIDTQQIKIGEQLHLTLQAIKDSGAPEIVWATVPDTFNHLMVISQTPIDTLEQNGSIIYQKSYTLTGFDSGEWHIPSFQFHTVAEKDTSNRENLRTDSLALFVHTVAVDTTKPFKPIKEIRTVPFNLLDYWPYILGGLVVLLILLYFLFYYKKKTKPQKEKPVPQIPPYEQAITGLNKLEKEQLWQQGEIKTYYSRLTDILRLFIQRQYHINAMEQTSDELLQKIKDVTQLNQKRDDLQYILQTADLAKFAKLQPAPEAHENCMGKARSLVEWCKPQPQKEEVKEKK